MELEPEVTAMNKVYEALKDLNDDAKQRVIEWAIGKFSLGLKKQRGSGTLKVSGQELEEEKIELTSFESLAEVFSKASPKTNGEKVLLAAAYLQESLGKAEITSREINKELHHLGHGIDNITSAIDTLMNRKPQFMIQTRKEGKTKQAQKKYKVTTEGFTNAKKMILLSEANQE